MDEEDFSEYITVLIIALLLFAFWVLTPINTLIHETGHSFVCLQQGGDYVQGNVEDGHRTTCKDINWSGVDVFWFLIAGVLAEVLLGLFLFSLPIASPLGAMMLIGVNWSLISGNYAFDLSQIVEIFPFFSIFQMPVVQYGLLIVSFMFLFLSFDYTYHIVKKLDIPDITDLGD